MPSSDLKSYACVVVHHQCQLCESHLPRGHNPSGLQNEPDDPTPAKGLSRHPSQNITAAIPSQMFTHTQKRCQPVVRAGLIQHCWYVFLILFLLRILCRCSGCHAIGRCASTVHWMVISLLYLWWVVNIKNLLSSTGAACSFVKPMWWVWIKVVLRNEVVASGCSHLLSAYGSFWKLMFCNLL